MPAISTLVALLSRPQNEHLISCLGFKIKYFYAAECNSKVGKITEKKKLEFFPVLFQYDFFYK